MSVSFIALYSLFNSTSLTLLHIIHCINFSLQAFTSKIFFNVDTHNFEPVQNLPDCPRAEGRDIGQGQAKETRASTHDLMFASASMETLYLTDDALGPVSRGSRVVCVLNHAT